ncbi:GIY-YIG nuclease family protein [Cellulophaga baltica]|uniref:NUMOD1 domain-containing protein,endonuclease n=1 Tax=Cellulophaga baltica 18 TaxID=1348584 RepID=A0AAU8RYX4_9FLAO|nr:GIY-YIG nuclease family protein [Cellulophaga baltica]AIZ41224.1 NUMOD1 domain-containing protein,endonuclease [Cellulophaga baltica 18]
MEAIGIIYKATNRENGKVYVGATTKSLEARKIDHIQKSKENKGSVFQVALGTFGPEAFIWEVIYETESINDLADKESYFISKFDCRNNGYNSDRGGGFNKKIYQYTIWGLMVMEHHGLHNAAWMVCGRKKSVSNACLGNNKTYKGYYWSYRLVDENSWNKDERKKPVIQSNMTGYKVGEYSSVSEASKVTGISKTCIARCCRGERNQSSGFIWKYIGLNN